MAVEAKQIAESLAKGSLIHHNALLHTGVSEQDVTDALEAQGFDLFKDPVSKNYSAKKKAAAKADAKS